MNKPTIRCSTQPAIEPKVGCDWADTMVLNPAIVKDPRNDDIHMLFRATGPWDQKNLKGINSPYPIFLGYAKSSDNGETWDADFSRPALAPAVAYEIDEMYITDINGDKVVNYANGCIEDPRIFTIEGEYYIVVACRMFPPGPYWKADSKFDNTPDWARLEDNPFGTTAYNNDTTSVLYKLDLEALIAQDYDNAFGYVCRLTDGNVTDNRDVFFFPEKMMINGKLQYVMMHRPHEPAKFETGEGYTKPSMFYAAAERLEDFATDKAVHQFMVAPELDWEEERIGGSFQPLPLGNGEWLISYHGKQLPDYGYTQSFMIVKEVADGFPEITHKCSERLLYATQDWELPDKFECPCIFTTGALVKGDELIMAYGAADQKVGLAWASMTELVAFVRLYDKAGKRVAEAELA